MSAFLYGRLEGRREGSGAEESTKDVPPGLRTYVEVFVGLVPSEVLVAASVFVAAFTDTKKGRDGTTTLVITDRSSLKIAFFGLVILALVLYVLGHVKFGQETNRWDRWDTLRMLIPPAAFVGWTMAQRPSPMFDAVTNISDGKKLLIVVFGGIILGVAAPLLGIKADHKEETARGAGAAPPGPATARQPSSRRAG